MLSKEDFKDYLAVCKKRRKLARYIRGSEELVAVIKQRQTDHAAALNELRDQTFTFFKDDLLSLQNYKDFLALLNNTFDLHTAAIKDEAKIKHFIAGLKEKLAPYEDFIKSIKALNKGRGKVVYLEGLRSKTPSPQ
jgi:hypothetical protein